MFASPNALTAFCKDIALKEAVEKHNRKNWRKISECLENRTDVQCLHRWQKVLNPSLVKGPWTPEVWFSNMTLIAFVLYIHFLGGREGD